MNQPGRRIRLEGVRAAALETGRSRLVVTGAAFAAAFLLIAARLVDIAYLAEPPVFGAEPGAAVKPFERADITDRNGVVLATSLPVAGLYADPAKVLDAEEAAGQLAAVLVKLDRDELYRRLSGSGRFVWLARTLTPRQQHAVNRLGIPGVGFQRAERRVYPHGPAAGHILGLTDIDGRGIAGVEKSFDGRLRGSAASLRLSIDIRAQTAVRAALSAAMAEFEAKGAAAVVLDADTAEVIAMVSLPEMDPNMPETTLGSGGFNRAAKGVYEIGSVFKLLNTAIALETGAAGLHDRYDASEPIQMGEFTISDFHGKHRRLSVPEILVYSSNIGSAKMAMDIGAKRQQNYLKRLGLLDALDIEIPETGRPMIPAVWRDINTMTISYGHGIAVTPLQITGAVAAVVNGGYHRPPTLLAGERENVPYEKIFSEKTSAVMRALMSLVVERGTGGRARVPGYHIGGKTGTAEKLSAAGVYQREKRISSFAAAFPIQKPRFVIFVMVDEPVAAESALNYATGGWVAAPAAGAVVRALAPMFAIAPDPLHLQTGDVRLRLASNAKERRRQINDAIRRMTAEIKIETE
ncbi:MAG: peptidoglycan D,D-transpeptidase FtsI family protein [Rhodospirillales bacterium]